MTKKMALEVIEYSGKHDAKWDDLIARSKLHSVLQTRKFLDYHHDKFNDQSVLIIDPKSGYVSAIFPAAVHPNDPTMVVSHPGSTFGGLLQRRIHPADYASMFALVLQHYAAKGFACLRLKTTPGFVGSQGNEIEAHFGLKHAAVVDCNLWTYLQLKRDFSMKDKAYDVRKARKAGLTGAVSDAAEDWRDFHAILEENLATRHDATPVHKFEELVELNERLVDKSKLVVVRNRDGRIVAGTWLIDYGNGVLHTQYICSTPEGRRVSAVDLLVAEAIEIANADHHVLSIGHCSIGNGWDINEGLMAFKLRFGLGVCIQTTFDYDLKSRNASWRGTGS